MTFAGLPLLDRRQFLTHPTWGLAGMATAWLLQREGNLRAADHTPQIPQPHFPPRARRVLHIFSPGGVSHVDTFDYKPELARLQGMQLTSKGTLDPFFGSPGPLQQSYYPFRQYGESGTWVSDLFPHLAHCADDLLFLHGVVSKSSSHTPACFQMNTGFTLNGYPSMGAWLSYGLGSEQDELPTFVVLPDPRGWPNGGSNNWSQGFLPAQHQGLPFRTDGSEPIAHLQTPEITSPAARRASLELLNKWNRDFATATPGDTRLAARLQSYELAARMQSSIPAVLNIADETAETQELYGLGNPVTAPFGKNCLLARRLLERGVRFVQLYNGGALGSPRINWDAHEDLKQNHDTQGQLLDKPCAGLLHDLKRRGLLNDTLILWSSEFGRTPFTQGVNGKGRDHHNHAFTCWLAGAGLTGGRHYGETDEVGYKPVSGTVTLYDLHATMLHLLGLDHTRLTFYHNGTERRLTDVHGEVIQTLL